MSNYTFTFYSWMRQGIAANINEEDQLNKNRSKEASNNSASYTAKIKLSGKAKNEKGSNYEKIHRKKINLFGPGEVTGIQKRAIVKTEPTLGTSNFEPNYLPFIEFYDEDFPWRYTPAKATDQQQKLRPWLSLIVCEEEQFQRFIPTNNNGKQGENKVVLPYIKSTSPGSIPFSDPEETWAWAHVQINGAINDTAQLADFIETTPNAACSRLVCPIRLKENTSYYAFLIPAFEQGRLAGLGASEAEIKSVSSQLAAWTETGETPTQQLAPEKDTTPPDLSNYANQWPIYFDWYFTTGKAVDFEYLVRLLEPRPMHPEVGRRKLDIQDAGWTLKYTAGDRTIPLEGALKIPSVAQSSLSPTDFIQDKAHQPYIDQLSKILNLNTDLKESNAELSQFLKDFFEETEGEELDDPVITPPLYGQYHAQKTKVKSAEKNAWFTQLNLNPNYRVAAGLGTEVIQKNQEKYMHRAWQQVRAVIAANKKRNKARLGREISIKIFHKNLAPFTAAKLEGKFLELTFPFHHRIKSKTHTIAHDLNKTTHLQNTMFHPAYNRIARSGGPALRRIGKGYALKHTHGTMLQETLHTAFADAAQNLDFIDGNQLVGEFMNEGLADKGNSLAGILSTLKQPTEIGGRFSTRRRNSRNFTTDLKKHTNLIAQRLHPRNSFAQKYKLKLSKDKLPAIHLTEPLVPAMAYPEFHEPIYTQLLALSEDYLLPNIHLVPPNTISLVEVNQAFVEAYMIGLNHKMARELFWREYPTDRRGSYFRQFWNALSATPSDNDKDIHPIDLWNKNSSLGAHKPNDANADNLVLLIRGELLKRFPNALIYLHKAEWKDDAKTRRQLSQDKQATKFPIFQAKAKPDISFIGFDISAKTTLGDTNDPGYFIIIEEQPGEPRFGFDIFSETDQSPSNWEEMENKSTDDLNWKVVGTAVGNMIQLNSKHHAFANSTTAGLSYQWNKNAGNMAAILHQKPFRIAVYAGLMLPQDE